MNYASIKKYDVANSPHVGCTLFVSGCTHKCKGCFNFEAQSFSYGNEFTKATEEYFILLAKDPSVKNINILGGEPFQQDCDTIGCLLQRLATEVGKPIWVWSGYKFEELINDPEKKELLKSINILIDGKFDITKKKPDLKYRGSYNQRVIDVPATLKTNKITLYKNGEF